MWFERDALSLLIEQSLFHELHLPVIIENYISQNIIYIHEIASQNDLIYRYFKLIETYALSLKAVRTGALSGLHKEVHQE